MATVLLQHPFSPPRDVPRGSLRRTRAPGPARGRHGSSTGAGTPRGSTGRLRGGRRQPLVPVEARYHLRLPRHQGRGGGDGIFKVTHRTRVILGVTCVAIEDTLDPGRHIGEHTTDGTRRTRSAVSGTGRAYGGVRRARPRDQPRGLVAGRPPRREGRHLHVRPSTCRPDVRQEFLPGQAEKHFKVVSRTASVTVPYGSFEDVLKTHEWTPLEPGVLDAKF